MERMANGGVDDRYLAHERMVGGNHGQDCMAFGRVLYIDNQSRRGERGEVECRARCDFGCHEHVEGEEAADRVLLFERDRAVEDNCCQLEMDGHCVRVQHWEDTQHWSRGPHSKAEAPLEQRPFELDGS